MLSKADQTASLHRVLLTFDDGPHPRHTVSVLDELARRELKGIFFVLGEQLEHPENQAILERLAGEGHLIGNHGYSQQNLTRLTDEQIRSQIRRTGTLIGDLDRGIKLWRPPFGERDSRVDAILASLGYTRMLWNVDSMDWSEDAQAASWVDRTLEKIRSRRIRGFRNTVCLLHDSLPATAAQLGPLLGRLGEHTGARVARYSPWHHEGLCLPEEPDPPASPLSPPDAVSFQIGDSRVVARTRLNAVYVLNESAGFLWDVLADGVAEPEAAQALASRYGISEELASRDVRSALADWRIRGLLGPKAPEMEDPGPWPRSSDELSIAGAARFDEEHAYCFLDLEFLIRFQTADLAASIHPRLANLEVWDTEASERVFEVSSIPGGCALRLPDGLAAPHSSAAAAGYRLFFEIVRLAHPELDPMACLHASLVSCGESTIALVANNGGGKSTLTAALAGTGLLIVSDDRLFLDFATRRPVATPNVVGLKRGSWSPLLSRYPGILQLPVLRTEDEELRLLLPPPPTDRLLPPVEHVFFPCYSATAVTGAIRLTSVQAIERIAASEGWISSDPAKLGAFLQWTDCARCYDLPFSSLDEAVEQIERCLRA